MKSKSIGDLIKALRCEKGLSQAELGERCGLSQAYLSDLERGHRAPNPGVIDRLAEYVGHRFDMYYLIKRVPDGDEKKFFEHFGKEKTSG